MAQLKVWEHVNLLESPDLQELDEIHRLIREHLSTDRSPALVNLLVDHYLETNSEQAMLILSMVQEPHDKHLLDKMNEYLGKAAARLSTLMLLGHVVRRQPSWKHKLSQAPILLSLLKCLKTDTDVVVLTTGVLVLITVLPMIPQSGKQYLPEFFDIFGRLSGWCLKNPGHVAETCLVHLHASVYALFHRLYGMYPCNFVSFLRSHYSMKENLETFEEIVKPMMEHVRIHPELVTGSKDHELDPGRWKRLETHDIVVECAKISLDPNEASYEEGYSPLSARLRQRQQETASSPFSEPPGSSGNNSTAFSTPKGCLRELAQRFHQDSEEQVPIWSPATMCGMTTPPSSPLGPPPESSLTFQPSSKVLITPGGKIALMSTPATSPPTLSSDDSAFLGNISSTSVTPAKSDGSDQYKVKQQVHRGEKGSEDSPKVVKTVSMSELPAVIGELGADNNNTEEAAISQELCQITSDRELAVRRGGFDSPFSLQCDSQTSTQRRTQVCDQPATEKHRCNGSQDASKQAFTPIEPPTGTENNSGKPQTTNSMPDDRNILTPSPSNSQARCRSCFNPAPYEHLFELALPKTASFFISKKTEELYKKFRGSNEETEENGKSVSPAEVLDRLIQLGADAHTKELNKLPLPSKSADWTHFGGSPPSDEIHVLRNQLVLLHNQLLYERFKRQQHALRNRRLLRKVIKVTALEEQNAAMKSQMKMQETDVQTLKQSLFQEQARFRRLREEKDTVVQTLQGQVRQLQQEREEFYSQNQELKLRLEECRTTIAELRTELKLVNHKACNFQFKFEDASQKLDNSEAAQQQMEHLNRQLMILGEANDLYVEQLRQKYTNTVKEAEMLQAAVRYDFDLASYTIPVQVAAGDATAKRIADLEAQLAKKDALFLEQKKFLEDVKIRNRGQLQAIESKYEAQKRICQSFEREILSLYCQLEREGLMKGRTEEKTETAEVAEERCDLDCAGVASSEETKRDEVNGSDAPAALQAIMLGSGGCSYNSSSSSSSSGSGSNQSTPEKEGSNPPHSHIEILQLPSRGHLTVGSYPSARSLLGIRARELFRNKSESHCDEDSISSLSEILKTELCQGPTSEVKDAPPPSAGSSGPSNVRVHQIMDYD
ncbi:hamartin [Hyperolius riggenbachi]|uniref:hamartin n=1 Tax=Hyperolius riggenbachi TaxID=752182 RepID=UPI0035A302C7